ncbi:hypothetical protein DSO57_1023926 [Entomophthora muscae]|nr:hypothetical protein DSO57_1023926 [Entomophthora muscae]
MHPLPPLPDLGAVVLEPEARWRNFHHKKGLADSIIQHSTEPPLGRHLRMAVRSCLHMAEVSPECIAVDQTMHPWESMGPSHHQQHLNRPIFQQSASIRAKFGHRHSRSAASIVSNSASLRGKANEAYSNQGAMLMSEDSLRKKTPIGVHHSPSALKKTDRRRALDHKPLFVEVFSPDNGSESDDESDEVFLKTPEPPKSPVVPAKPTRAQKVIKENSPAKSSLRIDSTANEKDSLGRSRSVKFDDTAIGGSVLFGRKDKPTPPPAKPLLDRHFFTDETTHEWNLPNYGKIRFTDHAPVAFRLIRRSFGYTLGDFDKALSVPFGSVTATAGKSEAIFFLTQNNAKFMFKTLRNSEPDNLKALLPEYLEHIRRNPNTLLPRYLGMYTFERISPPMREPSSPATNRSGFGTNGTAMSAMEAAMAAAFPLSQQQILPSSDEAFPPKMVLVAMANVFDTPLTIHERYDFKGSNVGRHTLPVSTTNMPPTPEERRQEVGHLTLKDLDFQYRVFQGLTNLIHLGPRNKEELMAQLEEDLALLKRFALMDYSVLVGIHRPPKVKVRTPPTSTPLPSIRGSRSGSIASSRNYASPLSSPHTQASIIPPFFSSASNLLSSILLPNSGSPQAKDSADYFAEPSPRPLPTGLSDSEDPNTPPIWQAGVRSVRLPNSEVYYIGIIDILQKYTIVKWLEKGLKGYNARLLGGVGTPTTAAAAIPFISRTGSTDLGPSRPSYAVPSSDVAEPLGGRKYSLSSSLPQAVPSLDNPLEISKAKSSEVKDNGECLSRSNIQRSSSSPQSNGLVRNITPTTPHVTPSSASQTEASSSTPCFPFPQQTEYSVEEPGRYSERLLEYMRGIVV